MGRPRKNPGYDSDIIQKEIIELVVQLHKKEYSYRNIAVELDLSVSKVGNSFPLFSIIVFSERCELKKVTVSNEDIKVIKRDRTYATIRSIWEMTEDVLTDDQANTLYDKFEELTNVNAAVKAAHIQNIDQKYKTSAKSLTANKVKQNGEAPVVETSGDSDIQLSHKTCPRCGCAYREMEIVIDKE